MTKFLTYGGLAAALVLTVVLMVNINATGSHIGKQSIEEAVANLRRPAADRKRDIARKPTQMLMFAGLEPGMTVLDINSSEGYYTEILSRAVGRTGRVIAHNDPTFRTHIVQERFDTRFKPDRLINVEHLNSASDVAVELEPASVDLAVMALAMHDYYVRNSLRGGMAADVPAVLAAFHRAIKPGGKLLVIDHVGPTGGTFDDWNRLHRIAPGAAQAALETAGFELVATSDMLANPDDDPGASPFRDGFRGHTDRFVHLYRKTE